MFNEFMIFLGWDVVVNKVGLYFMMQSVLGSGVFNGYFVSNSGILFFEMSGGVEDLFNVEEFVLLGLVGMFGILIYFGGLYNSNDESIYSFFDVLFLVVFFGGLYFLFDVMCNCINSVLDVLVLFGVVRRFIVGLFWISMGNVYNILIN